MSAFLTIDGSMGEGGGQILRTSLALSAITSTPIHIRNVRAGRKKPGLMRQHLTAVLAAARVCNARVECAVLRSQELTFYPGVVCPGDYHFSVGTAGSACLVFQTVLPPLLLADGPSRVVFEGGTHNPMSPPFDFIAHCFVPVLAQMGASVRVELERPGFMPAGGGRFVATIEPWRDRRRVELVTAGAVITRRARALVAKLDRSIGNRELRVIRDELGWSPRECAVEVIDNSAGPGNALVCHIERENVSEVVTAFGHKGIRAERVAMTAVRELRRYLAFDVPVGEHLADQLLLPMALAGGGRYCTLPLTLHARTNMEIIGMFLDVAVDIDIEKSNDRKNTPATVTIARR